MPHQDDVPKIPALLVPPTPPAATGATVSLASPEDRPFALGVTRRELQAAADFFQLAYLVRRHAWFWTLWCLGPLIEAFTTAGAGTEMLLLLGIVALLVAAGAPMLLRPQPTVLFVSGLLCIASSGALFLASRLTHLHPVALMTSGTVSLVIGLCACGLYRRYLHLAGVRCEPAVQATIRLLARGEFPNDEINQYRDVVALTTIGQRERHWYAYYYADDLLLLGTGHLLRFLHWSNLTITPRGDEDNGLLPVTIIMEGTPMQGNMEPEHLEAFHRWQAGRALARGRQHGA